VRFADDWNGAGIYAPFVSMETVVGGRTSSVMLFLSLLDLTKAFIPGILMSLRTRCEEGHTDGERDQGPCPCEKECNETRKLERNNAVHGGREQESGNILQPVT
jgi:hypothetical protein